MLQAGTKPTILVVEDYVDTQEMLKLLLEDMGFNVLTATTGNEALAAAANNHIDLVLTDFNLPDTSGPTVVRRLRQLNARLNHVPTVVLTAFDGFEYRNLAAEAGCDAYVVKPPNYDTLLAIIDRLLRASQAKQEMLLSRTC
jgi:DNA-binding response OmpR family regulator